MLVKAARDLTSRQPRCRALLMDLWCCGLKRRNEDLDCQRSVWTPAPVESANRVERSQLDVKRASRQSSDIFVVEVPNNDYSTGSDMSSATKRSPFARDVKNMVSSVMDTKRRQPRQYDQLCDETCFQNPPTQPQNRNN